MTHSSPLGDGNGIQNVASDELTLTPDAGGINVCIGLGGTPEGEAIPLIRLVFTDPEAGPIGLVLDTRTGHAERIHGQLQRLLSAIHQPEQHPEDADEVEQILGQLVNNYRNRQ